MPSQCTGRPPLQQSISSSIFVSDFSRLCRSGYVDTSCLPRLSTPLSSLCYTIRDLSQTVSAPHRQCQTWAKLSGFNICISSIHLEILHCHHQCMVPSIRGQRESISTVSHCAWSLRSICIDTSDLSRNNHLSEYQPESCFPRIVC